jgi:replicative DNA helicase
MKTMLLQNWMHQLARPTYFLELEMSPRQIWGRFLSIHLEKDEEDIKQMHKEGKLRGISKQFDWLTVDYNSCNSRELAKKIQMLSVKPEIVVVDHMGLFSSTQKDANAKLEEISQSLMELAIQQNVIVFAVSEISKTAMREGMDISSSRGSFRVAYNANKILSINPTKTPDGLVRSLTVNTTANREKESLRLELFPNNCKLVTPQNLPNGLPITV